MSLEDVAQELAGLLEQGPPRLSADTGTAVRANEEAWHREWCAKVTGLAALVQNVKTVKPSGPSGRVPEDVWTGASRCQYPGCFGVPDHFVEYEVSEGTMPLETRFYVWWCEEHWPGCQESR